MSRAAQCGGTRARTTRSVSTRRRTGGKTGKQYAIVFSKVLLPNRQQIAGPNTQYLGVNFTTPDKAGRVVSTLRDGRTRAIILARLARVSVGSLGNTRSVGEGVYELKVDYGPGYRGYFGHDGIQLIILLNGGDKSTQEEDIETATTYWQAYQKEHRSADD